MRYGIFSDIHSNLEAFEAVIEALSRESVDRYLCVGDIVGYGANPKECIQKVRELQPLAVCGNHDWASVGLIDITYFNSAAKEAVCWTGRHIDEADRSFLKKLPLVEREDDIVLVHGTLPEPENFEYLLDEYAAYKTFQHLDRRFCFVGHSHVPVIFYQDGPTIGYSFESKMQLSENRDYIINVGSVGQPRDGNPDATFVIFDKDKNTVEVKRVPYDVKKAQDKIIKAGLPEILAIRLEKGR
jgi:diadenosine tetraphosphatase ApaH/serine/threonine PP2A family protein phosphatase